MAYTKCNDCNSSVDSEAFKLTTINVNLRLSNTAPCWLLNNQRVAYIPYMGLYMELGNLQYCCFRGPSPDDIVGIFAHSGVFGDYLEWHVAILFIRKIFSHLKSSCESLMYLKTVSSDNSRTKKPFLKLTCIKYLFLFKIRTQLESNLMYFFITW